MEETIPIIHSPLMRRNRNFSENPYGATMWYLPPKISRPAIR